MGSNGVGRNQYADLDEEVAEKFSRIRMSECKGIFVPIDPVTKEVMPSVPARLPENQQPRLTRQIVTQISTCFTEFLNFKTTTFDEAQKKAKFGLEIMKWFMKGGPPKGMSNDFEAELEGETGKTIAGTADGMRQNWEQFQEAEQSVDPREEEESHDGDDD